MKKIFLIFKFFCGLLMVNCSLPIANCLADVKYVVAKDGSPGDSEESVKHVYIYGGYNLHFANDAQGLEIANSRGGLTGGFGFRFTDNIRSELSYEYMKDNYKLAAATGNFGIVNFIFDAKLPPQYRIFKTSPFVPFVGFGVGAGRYSGLQLTRRNMLGAYNFIGGVSLEINRTLAFAFTYKFMKIIANELTVGSDVIPEFEPSGHNVSATFRMNF
ncbi:MAG: outer membrane beta-barrel protein [Rickettsiales bacterium]|jgi:hypothetical protein|nr:outer membrane beta-barrel protein [Rickettsiales bacterium]